MPIEVITAIIAAVTTLITCLIKAHIEQKKMKEEFDRREKEREERGYERFSAILDEIKEKNKQQDELVTEEKNAQKILIGNLQHSLNTADMTIKNMEGRLSEKIENLSKHVERHNNFAVRMPVIEEQIKVINHRLNDLEKK